MLEHGAYTLLIDSCYDRERFPTLDDAIEWTWARTDEEKAAVVFILDRFFEKQGDLYIQKRIQEEIDRYHANSLINKEIAIKREAKRKEKSTNREPSVNEPPPNQEPLTNINISKDMLSLSATHCPQNEILKLWAEKLPEAIQPREWTPARQKLLQSRWKEKKNRQDVEWWSRLFGYIAESDFLMGRTTSNGRKPFGLTLQWLLKPENMASVIEGKYHG